jgi:hypothetical protein
MVFAHAGLRLRRHGFKHAFMVAELMTPLASSFPVSLITPHTSSRHQYFTLFYPVLVCRHQEKIDSHLHMHMKPHWESPAIGSTKPEPQDTSKGDTLPRSSSSKEAIAAEKAIATLFKQVQKDEGTAAAGSAAASGELPNDQPADESPEVIEQPHESAGQAGLQKPSVTGLGRREGVAQHEKRDALQKQQNEASQAIDRSSETSAAASRGQRVEATKGVADGINADVSSHAAGGRMEWDEVTGEAWGGKSGDEWVYYEDDVDLEGLE